MNTNNDSNTPWYLNSGSRRNSRQSSDSPIGAFPSDNDSPIGAFPSGNDSPIGAFPSGNDSPIGAFPSGNDSPIGAFPSWSDSYQRGYGETYDYHRENEVNDFGNADNADMRAIPPYQPFEQSSYTQSEPWSYDRAREDGFQYNTAPPQSRPYSDGSIRDNDDSFIGNERRAESRLPGVQALGALPRTPLLLFSGWTTLTMILTIVLMCCGQTWAIVFELIQLIPLAAFFAAASDKHKLRSFFILAGISTLYMTGVALLKIFDPKAQFFDPMLIVPNLVMLIFYTPGILMMTVPTIALRRRQRRCSEAVQGVIVKVDRQRRRRQKGGTVTVYCPTFEYTFRGQTYKATEGVFSSGSEPIVGNSVPLLIDPDEPTFITDIEEHRSSIFAYRIVGAFFLGFCMIAFLAQFAPVK